MVEFENVTARYPLRFDIILKHLTFQIMPGQHVAIVGRTGSGKSSLIMSLFRMLENLDGSIGKDKHYTLKIYEQFLSSQIFSAFDQIFPLVMVQFHDVFALTRLITKYSRNCTTELVQ